METRQSFPIVRTFLPIVISISVIITSTKGRTKRPISVKNADVSSDASTTTPNVPNVTIRPDIPEAIISYDITNGPLACTAVWPWLNRLQQALSTAYCKYQWSDTIPLPQLQCESLGGFNPLGGSYSTILHNKVLYQLAGTAGESGRWSGWCAYQSSFDLRKVDSLLEVASVSPWLHATSEESLVLGITNWMQEGKTTNKEILQALLSQGLQHLRLDFGPMGIGANAALMVDTRCPTCPAEFWRVHFHVEPAELQVFLNRAWRILMEINSAYVSLAMILLRELDKESLVEEIKIEVGERWEETYIIPNELPLLRTLDISGNGISSLEETNFLHMPNLLHLDLSYNRLSTIPSGIRLLRHLKTLDLSQNPIMQTNVGTPLHLLPLEELKVSGCPLGKLDYLLLNDTSGYPDMAFSRSFEKHMYSQLELLDVSGCNISDVDSGGARSLWALARNLRILRLADNPLASVPPQLAERLPALQELDLSGCLLAAPPALRLAPAQRLRLLQLARNLLETPAGALQEASAGGGAALLDLSGNPLRGEWGAGAFAPLGARASVNLSRTQLTALSPTMLRSLQPLRVVDLGGNPFDCGACSILELKDWLTNTTGPEVLRLGARLPLLCGLPLSLRGRPVVDAEGPARESCVPTPSGWSPASIAGLVTAVVLLAAAALAHLAFRFRLHITYVLHVIRANRALKNASKGPFAHCDFDAFVCYSKHDRAWVVGELLPRLEGSCPRYRLCLHERDFPLGALVVQNIVECMERSRRTLIVLTPAFIKSQWCQWELEMATHRLVEGAGRDFLVLVELQRLEARALPRLLRLLVETRTFLQWPSGGGSGGEGAEETAWKRLRAALGPPMFRASSRRPLSPQSSCPAVALPAIENPFYLIDTLTQVQVDRGQDKMFY